MDSCFYCLFSRVVEPECFDDAPYWICSCKSSSHFGKDIPFPHFCSFFIPEYLYNYLVEEARACNSE